MKYNETGMKIFTVISYIVVVFVTVCCFLPFILMLSGSFSENSEIMSRGYSLLPRGFSTYAYKTIFENPTEILGSYGVTIARTVIGTFIGTVCVSMAGFVLSRPDFKYRNIVAFFMYFTTIFNGGTVPWYIVTTRVLGLYNNFWALILPMCISAFNIFLFKNFLSNVPHDMVESARIDGAGDFRIYAQIMMPLAKPALATVALFIALTYWNDWFQASLLVSGKTSLHPIQYVLFKMMSNASAVTDTSVIRDEAVPSETMKLAMGILTAGPVLMFYPFAQKYFVGGLTIGSVKG